MSEVKGMLNAEMLGVNVASIIYNQGKARLFNVLESQYENEADARLHAQKRIVEDILSSISKQTNNLIVDILGDWQEEITADGELTNEELKEAEEDYKTIDKILK